MRVEDGCPDPGVDESCPVWVRCLTCEEYWCVRHQSHASDCVCPPIEEWIEHGGDPYNAARV